MSRERVIAPKDETSVVSAGVYATSGGPLKSTSGGSENTHDTENDENRPNCSARSLLKSASISGSQCVVVKEKKDNGVSMQQSTNLQFFFIVIFNFLKDILPFSIT